MAHVLNRGERALHPARGRIRVVPKDTMTLSEASTYLAMDAEALSRLAAERSIPSMEVDGRWIFSKKSIDKWRRFKESKGK